MLNLCQANSKLTVFKIVINAKITRGFNKENVKGAREMSPPGVCSAELSA
jgi:hypothetical protein